MRPRTSVAAAAFCGLVVSVPAFLVGSYAFVAFVLSFIQQTRISALHPEYDLHPGSIFFNTTFAFLSLTVLLSIVCGTTAIGLLSNRKWAIKAAGLFVPPFALLLFLGDLCAVLATPPLPSGAPLAIGPGLALAIIAYALVPFLLIGAWWLILFSRKALREDPSSRP